MFNLTNIYDESLYHDDLKHTIRIKVNAYRSDQIKEPLRFLEHVFDNTTRNSRHQILAQADETLYESNDLGETWQACYVNNDGLKRFTIRNCFTLKNGDHLLQTKAGKIYHFDNRWNRISKQSPGNYPWHGTWSIDQNPQSEVIIWCEYAKSVDELAVWRSNDNAKSWNKVFSQKGRGEDKKEGQIRHFHVCQHCSSQPGRWYLTSGDTEKETKFWVSEDDGLSWKRVEIHNIQGEINLEEQENLNRLFRFTSLVQTEDAIIFPTDDTLERTGSLVAKMEKNKLGYLTIFPNICGANESRNFVKLSKTYSLVVSESKIDRSRVDLTLVDLNGKLYKLPSFPNKLKIKTPFMESRSSKAAINGVFFSYSDARMLDSSSLLKWEIVIN